jgi:FtsP/CotA-like multicopper oxidase with cupredoxin domain
LKGRVAALSGETGALPGRFVLHCHILNDEEIGMMQLIDVYEPT